MKYQGLKEVECIVYPNDYVYTKKKGILFNFVMLNLLLCCVVGVFSVILKFFGTSANEILEIIVNSFVMGI